MAVGGRCSTESADRASEIHTGGHPVEAQGQLLPSAGLRCCDLKWRMCHKKMLFMLSRSLCTWECLKWDQTADQKYLMIPIGKHQISVSLGLSFFRE